MSYPEGRSPGKTCYKYEPWHFRYVGRPFAERVRDSGLSLREWLWRRGGDDDLDRRLPVTPSADADADPDADTRADDEPTPDPTRRRRTRPGPSRHAAPHRRADRRTRRPSRRPSPTAPTPPAPTPDRDAGRPVRPLAQARMRADSRPRRSQITIATAKRAISDSP